MAGSAATGARTGRPGRPLAFYLAGLLVMFVASAAGAVVYVQVQSGRDAERQARADARFAAKAAAKELGTDVSLLKATVKQLAANPSIAGVLAHPAGCTLTFAGGGTTQGHVDLLRPGGATACSSRKPGADGKLAGYVGQRWVRAAAASPLFLAPFRDSATGGREAAMYAAPGPGKVVVAAFLDLTSVGPSLKAVYGGGKPAEFLVVDRSGTVIARSIDPVRWVGSSPAGTRLPPTGGVGERRDLNGVRRIYAAAPVPGSRWRLFVGEDRAAALAAGTRLRDRELAIVLSSLALILLATMFVYRRTVLPMKRLSAAVRAAAQDHPGPVPASGPAEVAELAGQINTLTASVNAQEVVRRAKEEAERANEAKSRFLSHMSHELRTPLAAILGFAELLHREARSEPKRTWSRHVLEGGRHLLELVNELLEISRIEAGKVMLTIRPVDVDQAVDDALDLMAPLAADRGIRIERPGQASHWNVLADPLRLKQVLLNLVSNAIKYNREAGTVSVSVEDRGRDTVRVAVTDTGQGISPEHVESLFSPFERLGAEEGPVSGSGLGLVVTKGLVEAMGGHLGVTSEPGVGTTFAVDLPRKTSTVERRGPSRQPEPAPATSGSVLYIDDNPTNLELVEGVLAEMRPGLELRTAMQGAEGARLAEDRPPDLLLLDLNLHDISGEEVLRRLRARPQTVDVPLIILSADSTARNVTRLLQSGADAYLTKPLDVQAFLDVVDRLLTTHEPTRQAAG